MKRIPLTQGKFALVDDEDFEYLSQWKWMSDDGYAVRREYLGGGRKNAKYQKVRMHRLITNCPVDKETDHIDLNGFNNQKSNLRIATHQQNCQNRRVRSDSKSGIKCVYWNNKIKKWVLDIRVKNKRIHLEFFDDLSLAGKQYDEIVKESYKEFANLNFLS